jgi:hypothetical protein
MTMPPSHSARPPTLCPPLRIATSNPFSRANRTAATTSASPEQRAIRPRYLSMLAFQMRRAASYGASPSRTAAPRNELMKV